MFKFTLLISLIFYSSTYANSSSLSATMQLTAESGEGTKSSTEDAGPKYGADRIRLSYKAQGEKYSGKITFALDNVDKTASDKLPRLIHDAYTDIKLGGNTNLKFGLFKTPLGMDYHQSGSKLDIAKRGMDKRLVIDRSIGLMISQDITETITFDLAHVNPPKRSSAVDDGVEGTDSAIIGRITYKSGSGLTAQVASGTAPNAAGEDTEDYQVVNFGLKQKMNRWTIKLEHIVGSNLRGIEDDSQAVNYLHLGYDVNDKLELVIRHYMAEAEISDEKTTLNNTFAGFNYNLEKTDHLTSRFQLNFVHASGDKEDFAGLGGYEADAVLALLQLKY